jgi:pilus assembly protein CpaD
MTQVHRTRTVSAVLAASFGLAIAVGGCAQQRPALAPAPITPVSPRSEATTFRNQVVSTTMQTQVRFLPGDFGAIAPDEGARLEAFLNTNDVSPGAHVMLSTSGSMAPAEAVRDRLVAHGVRPGDIVIRSAAPRGRSNLQVVDVSVEQYRVQPPECGRWNPDQYFEDTSTDFGCSTVRALGLMVADPHDLVAGKNAGHTSAPPQVGAIERYHTDKQTPFVANKIGTE